MKHDFNFEIGSALLRINRLLALKFIDNPDNLPTKPNGSQLYTSAIVEIIIHLDFILMSLSTPEGPYNTPVSFSDDIPTYKPRNINYRYSDITTLVHFYRNAVCHHNATPRMLSFDGKQKIRFVYQTGAKEQSATGIPHLCKYDDDIAILMGNHVLYVNRHIKRAYREAEKILFSLPRFLKFKKLLEFRADKFR